MFSSKALFNLLCLSLLVAGADTYSQVLSADAEERHDSRSPAMRNACDAFFCSVFRYVEDRLTVFPSAGIAERILPSEIPSKSFAWGSETKDTT
jgi:hypothetical protein